MNKVINSIKFAGVKILNKILDLMLKGLRKLK